MKTTFCVFILAILSGCSKTPSPDVAQQVFTDTEHMAAMASAKLVTAHRLHLKLSDQAQSRAWKFDSYEQSGSVQLSPFQADELKQMLQKPTSYVFDSVKGCIPNYGVLFVFHTKAKDIEVSLCFECKTLGVFDRDRQLNTEEDFDPIQPKLVALTKALFVNDPEIQSLH